MFQKLQHLENRNHSAIVRRLERADSQFAQLGRLLEANSFERVLDRGFALVTDAEGKAVKKSAEIPKGAEMAIRFSDDTRQAVFDGSVTPSKIKAKKAPQKSSPKLDQEELF